MLVIFRNSVGDVSAQFPQEDLLESSYVEYLCSARICLDQCKRACRNWTTTYDGRSASDGRLCPADNRLNRISFSGIDGPSSEGVVPVTCSKKTIDGAVRPEHRVAHGPSAAEHASSSASVHLHGMHCGDNGLQGFSAAMSIVRGTSVSGDGLWATSARTGGSIGELNRIPLSGLLPGASLLEDLDTFLVQLSRVQVPESESRLEEVLGDLDLLLTEAENQRIASVAADAQTVLSEATPNPVSSQQSTGTLPQVVVAISSDTSSTDQPEALNVVSSSFFQTSLEPTKSDVESSDNPSILLRPTSLDRRGQPLLSSASSSARSLALSPTIGKNLVIHSLIIGLCSVRHGGALVTPRA